MGRQTATQPAVNRGDSNAIRGYRDSLKAIHKRLSDLGGSADGPVDDALKALDGPWKDDFAAIWQQVSLDPMKYLLTWSGDQKVNSRYLQQEYANGDASSQWQTVLDGVQAMADYLDWYQGAIDQEVATDDKAVAKALFVLGGLAVLAVVTVATLGTTTEATVPAAGALILWGAGIGAGTFAAMDFTDQMIQNTVANHDSFGTALASINMGELFASALEGAVFGGVAAVLTVALAPVLTAGLGTFLPMAGARALGLTLASGAGGMGASVYEQQVQAAYTGIDTGDWSHLGQIDPVQVLQAGGLTALSGGLVGVLSAGVEVPAAQVAAGQTPPAEPALQLSLTGSDGQPVTLPAREVTLVGPDGQLIGTVTPEGSVSMVDPNGVRVTGQL